MTCLRLSLLLLAVVALFTAGTPATAGTGEPALPAATAVPEVALDVDLCAENLTPVPAAFELAVPPNGDFILCTCRFCKDHPDTDCQISPKGYSILCADWYRRHC